MYVEQYILYAVRLYYFLKQTFKTKEQQLRSS